MARADAEKLTASLTGMMDRCLSEILGEERPIDTRGRPPSVTRGWSSEQASALREMQIAVATWLTQATRPLRRSDDEGEQDRRAENGRTQRRKWSV